jgi:hypothetical protein
MAIAKAFAVMQLYTNVKLVGIRVVLLITNINLFRPEKGI